MSADPIGANPGGVSDPEDSNLSNTFATIPDQSLEAIADRVAPRQVASGMTRGVQQLGSDQVYSDGGNNQIIVEDSNEPRVLMGKQATFGEGFYVTKDGFNVKTNTNPDNFIFNSAQNAFKVAKIVTGSYLVTATDAANAYANFSFSHGLTIRPTVLGSFYRSSDSLTRQLPFNFRSPTQSYYTTSAPGALSHTSSASVEIYNIDDTSINVQVKIFDILGLSWLLAGVSFNFKFYCLQETIISA